MILTTRMTLEWSFMERGEGKKEAGFKDMGHTKKGVEEKAIESKE